MAKTKEPPKPLFPIKHEFYASLDNFAHQAGMLSDVCRQLIKMELVDKEFVPTLQERLDAFHAARFGGDEQ